MPYKDQETQLKYHRKYWKDHREKLCAQQRKYYSEHKDELRKRDQERYQNNKEKRKQCARRSRFTKHGRQLACVRTKNRRYLKRTFGKGITPKQWDVILKKHNFRCAYCGIHEVVLNALGEKITMDHVIPLSEGGEHSIDNVVPACTGCNSKKYISLDWKSRVV